jgi:hypothetical protein
MDLNGIRELIENINRPNNEVLEQANLKFQELVNEEPENLFLVNIENIRSLHATAKNSAILLQREIGILKNDILKIQNQDFPNFLLNNLLEILIDKKYSEFSPFLSTSLARLTKVYIPEGIWSNFFDVFFNCYDSATVDVQCKLLDILQQIYKYLDYVLKVLLD